MGLDALDIKGLKATINNPGYTASFGHRDEDGSGYLTIRQEIRDMRDHYAGTVTVADIKVESYITGYDTVKLTDASYGFTGLQWTPEWVSLVKNLRVNDHITLHWTGSNNSIALEEAGLCRDEFRVKIMRPRTNKDSDVMEFLMAVEVTRRDNWRMVRP